MDIPVIQILNSINMKFNFFSLKYIFLEMSWRLFLLELWFIIPITDVLNTLKNCLFLRVPRFVLRYYLFYFISQSQEYWASRVGTQKMIIIKLIWNIYVWILLFCNRPFLFFFVIGEIRLRSVWGIIIIKDRILHKIHVAIFNIKYMQVKE